MPNMIRVNKFENLPIIKLKFMVTFFEGRGGGRGTEGTILLIIISHYYPFQFCVTFFLLPHEYAPTPLTG